MPRFCKADEVRSLHLSSSGSHSHHALTEVQGPSAAVSRQMNQGGTEFGSTALPAALSEELQTLAAYGSWRALEHGWHSEHLMTFSVHLQHTYIDMYNNVYVYSFC